MMISWYCLQKNPPYFTYPIFFLKAYLNWKYIVDISYFFLFLSAYSSIFFCLFFFLFLLIFLFFLHIFLFFSAYFSAYFSIFFLLIFLFFPAYFSIFSAYFSLLIQTKQKRYYFCKNIRFLSVPRYLFLFFFTISTIPLFFNSWGKKQ